MTECKCGGRTDVVEVGQHVGDKVRLYVSAEVGLYVCD